MEHLVKITDTISVIDCEILRDSFHTFTFMLLSDGREVMTLCKKDEIMVWIYAQPKYLDLYRKRKGYFDYMYDRCHHKFAIIPSEEETIEIFSSFPYSKIISYIKRCL